MNRRQTRFALVLLAVFAGAYAATRRIGERRLAARPAAQPEHVQTWEGEGGAVPVEEGRTAAQVRAAERGSPVGDGGSSVLPH